MLLSLKVLHERHRALTPSIAGTFEEAAAVCLSRHHVPPTAVTLSDNGRESSGQISWTQPDTRTIAAWGNARETTGAGTCGCVIVGVEQLRGLVAVRRAETGTGADYYIGLPDAGDEDLEDCFSTSTFRSCAKQAGKVN